MDVWPAIRKTHPLASLFLIGSGDEHPRLAELARKTPGVHLIEAVDDVVPYLQAADLFVLPSEREGLSNALLEAMSCGLPAVATAVGGSLDVIKHSVNGFLIPFGDAAQMLDTLNTVLADAGLRHSVGTQARETILNQYSLARTARSLRSLYDSLLSTPGAGSTKELEASA
jgi:glycosyltransferase involved in cell wall biosynthesis